jgi:hypothetical protein
MKKILSLALLVSAFNVVPTVGEDEKIRLKASLKSFNEVPANVTNGTGTFEATINDDTSITFTLTYKNLSTNVVQSHIHVGSTKTNGAVAIFFCGPANSAAHQTCPNDSTNSGTVSGTVAAADVVINGQGIAPGEFAKVLRAIAHGDTYVNVHTKLLPLGEIRGQVVVQGEDDNRDDR